MKIEVGKTYDVRHSRKGRFTMRVTDVRSYWISGEIVAGRAHYLSQQNQGEGFVGDAITISSHFATFEEVQDEATANTDPAHDDAQA